MYTVHEPGIAPTCAGTVPALNDRVVPPGAAVTVPPQVLLKFTGFAIKRPGWTPTKLSVQVAAVNWKALGLNMVTLRRDTPPAAMEIGKKLLFISAGKDTT
jgi:hypothetical protein